MDEEVQFVEHREVFIEHYGEVPIVKGSFNDMPKNVQAWVASKIDLCKPRGVYICDGSQEEAETIIHKLEERGTLHKLKAYENNYICKTDPKDVARVEGLTYIVSHNKHDSVPHVRPNTKGILAQWMSYAEAEKLNMDRWPGCMAGRMMYVIPFSMGPVGSPLSKIGVQVTDSNYVLLCMRIMTRVTPKVWDVLKKGKGDFVKCLHSMGSPRPNQRKVINHWPCNPDKVLILHYPEERKVTSFGSGYGGNSLLGKKCFALRIAGVIARDEGWLAEHMLIMSVTNPKGQEKFIAAAFPSACGKTNMALLTPTIPGYKVQCIGDDIAWMRFEENGELRGINPEAGFFGVAPGTNEKTNPIAVQTFQSNSIFTNVAETEDGHFFWEGMEDKISDDTEVVTWLGGKWKKGNPEKAAHPNSRFCTPAGQCPIMHPMWEDPKGVPISAIIFGGRRPEGVPLVLEAFDWKHGVMLGAQLKSETTAAAEFKGKKIMHDPMAMRPFIGYNFGKYLDHWLEVEKPPHKVPKIFHVNWFRVDSTGKFLWPGFGDNIRVLDWIMRRVDGEDIAVESPIGLLPKKGSINLDGLGEINWDELFSIPKDYWLADIKETMKFLDDQTGEDLPQVVRDELQKQADRINAM
ncbi:phosphoenolpyruvate carboxykinase [GTP] [Lingula anatina]|uniref:phosphoenolpyruvate carboxykinase (GTP) n=1 Tax=Lingula anatina TaxID=7574 RepID=A0A1S3H8M1_LINAN|nr:phosphoenolpyruvate carboxykinase [GTP] [Lingula anatina]|eukprot:XP_013418183.1 phosphoenolpyruvate carboxykinase [GTP] [Lingula anatina]